MDIIAHARSGHPGMPMGTAEILAYLYGKFMRYHPKYAGTWINRDRLILSAGHGALGQYIALHMAGLDISIEDLRQHRQGSIKASSHPLYNPSIGIETTTGADGYGTGNAVGIALAQKILAHQFYPEYLNEFNEKIIVIGGDGCFMEGISYEAGQLAGHWNLNNLIVMYDANRVTLDGLVEESCSTDYVKLYEALGFEVYIIDGHDLSQIDTVFQSLRKNQKKPAFIIANTEIGRGLLNHQGLLSAHSSQLKQQEIEAFQKMLIPDYRPWHIPDEIYQFFQNKHQTIESKIKLAHSSSRFPNEEELLTIMKNCQCTETDYPGRFLSNEVLNHLAQYIPQIYSGSADSARSDGTWLENQQYLSIKTNYLGRNIKFGVREFAMAAIANGLAQSQHIIPVIGGFLAFSDYLKAALRFTAMMKLKVICSFSHDSIFLGEDGPTHQPIEQLTMFRAMPNTLVIRPADVSEIKFAWIAALNHAGPTVIALSRQPLKNLHLANNYGETVRRGAYIIGDSPRLSSLDVMLFASGSEVKIALDVAKQLNKEGVSTQVISVPSFELFNKQPLTYQVSILNQQAKVKVSIEAAHELSWRKFIGTDGISIAVNDYGIATNVQQLKEHYGFHVNEITEKIILKLQSIYGHNLLRNKIVN